MTTAAADADIHASLSGVTRVYPGTVATPPIHGRFQRQLCKAVEGPDQSHAARERIEAVDEAGRAFAIEKVVDKVGKALFVPLVGGEPVRLLLALTSGFDDEHFDPIDETGLDAGERPGAEQRLIDHIFMRPRGYP